MGKNRTSLQWVALIGAAIVLTGAAGLMLFSTFMVYDDEGYVLFSIRNFVDHGNLYGQVYSQYGPVPFVLYDGLHRLGLPLTHTAGRLLTLAAWSGTAVLCSCLIFTATRSAAAAYAALTAVFIYLWMMVSEPMHPGGMIALLTGVLAVIGYRWICAGKDLNWAILAGSGCAALILTKINVGVFAVLSTLAFLLLNSRHARVRSVSLWLVAGVFVILPFALMASLFEVPWVRTYAFIFALSAFPAVTAASLGAQPRFGLKDWRAASLAGALVVCVVLGVVCARGTSGAELLDGVLLGPLRHPQIFNLNFRWPASAPIVALGSSLAFVVCLGQRRRQNAWINGAVAWARLLVSAALGAALMEFPAQSPTRLVFSFSASFLWLFLWPIGDENRSALLARAWIGLLFLGQYLHAFPVPVSQIGWGTYLSIPIAILGAWHAASWIARHQFRAIKLHRVAGILSRSLLVVGAAILSGHLAQIGSRYFQSRDFNLRGAESVRVPDSNTALYQLLTLNAATHADMVFSLPGMFSFNLWSGRPAPTLANVTHWFSLLNHTQQRAIIHSLETHPRACVILQKDLVEFLRVRGLTPTGPLYDYVMATFKPAFEIDRFQFCVRVGRSVAPFQTAEVFQRAGPSGPGGLPDTLLTLHLLLPAGQQIGSVLISRMDDVKSRNLILHGSETRIETTPINLENTPLTGPSSRAFPLVVDGPTIVSLYFNRGDMSLSPDSTLVTLRDPSGVELALLRLRP